MLAVADRCMILTAISVRRPISVRKPVGSTVLLANTSSTSSHATSNFREAVTTRLEASRYP